MRLVTMVVLVALLPACTLATPVFVKAWGSAGSGPGQFQHPFGVAVGPDGSVYVADTNNHRVQKFTNNGDFVLEWGTDGAGDGQFNTILDVAVDAQGDVYTVEETANQRVQKFTSSGSFITKWGLFGSCDAYFNEPMGVDVDADGYVYVADYGNSRIQKFTSQGVFVTKWGSWTGDCAPDVYPITLPGPVDVAVDASGHVVVTAYVSVWSYTTSGVSLGVWGSEGSGPGQFMRTGGVAVDGAGRVYVADVVNNRVEILANMAFVDQFGSPGSGPGQFNYAYGVAVDAQGDIFVSDVTNNRIEKFSQTTVVPVSRASWGQVKVLYR